MKLGKMCRNGLLALSATALTFPSTAYAAGMIDDGGVSNKIIKQIVNVITTMAVFIGIVLLAWSVLMLMLAFKNEDADSKSRAIMLIVVSIMLIGFGSFLTSVLEAAGVAGFGGG